MLDTKGRASVVQDGGNFAWSYCLGKSHIDSHKDPPHLTSKNMSQLFASRTLRAKSPSKRPFRFSSCVTAVRILMRRSRPFSAKKSAIERQARSPLLRTASMLTRLRAEPSTSKLSIWVVQKVKRTLTRILQCDLR